MVSAIAALDSLASIFSLDLGEGTVGLLALVGIILVPLIRLGVWVIRGLPTPWHGDLVSDER